MCAKYKKATPTFKGGSLKTSLFFLFRREVPVIFRKLVVLQLGHDAQEVGALKIVAVLFAETGVDILLGEDADGELVVAAVQTAPEGQVHGFCVVMTEDDILGFDVFDILLLLLALLDVTVQFAVLCDRVSPEFAAAARFLTDFQLDTLFLFVLR